MGCRLIFTYTQDLDKLFTTAKKEADAIGGEVIGNKQTGQFSIPAMGSRFEGQYKVSNVSIEILLLKKPLLLPCSLINSFLSQYIK